MWKTGHSLIKSKMKETQAPLAGEMSGHIFFADEYYGFDDALYAAIRLIAASARLGKSVTELKSAMPAMLNTPELRFQVDESRKFAAIEEVKQRLAGHRRRRQRHRRRARDHARRLVAAARLEHAGRARRARRELHAGRPRPPARADRRAARSLGPRARAAGGALSPGAAGLDRELGAFRPRSTPGSPAAAGGCGGTRRRCSRRARPGATRCSSPIPARARRSPGSCRRWRRSARAAATPPPDGLHTLYVSPLKALAHDVQRNLVDPGRGDRPADPDRDPQRRHAVRPQEAPARPPAACPADHARNRSRCCSAIPTASSCSPGSSAW